MGEGQVKAIGAESSKDFLPGQGEWWPVVFSTSIMWFDNHGSSRLGRLGSPRLCVLGIHGVKWVSFQGEGLRGCYL